MDVSQNNTPAALLLGKTTGTVPIEVAVWAPQSVTACGIKMVFYCENHAEHVNTTYGQIAELFNFKAGTTYLLNYQCTRNF
jgi:hypothetical protein